MKLRSFLLCLFISAFVLLGNGQTIIYQTSFESGQDQWTAPGGDNHWQLENVNLAHSGSSCWVIDEGKSYSHTNDYIVSEEFVLNAGYDHYFLTLWANPEMRRCDSPIPGLLDEQYEVYIRDVNTEGDFQTLFYEYDRDYPADSKGYEFIDKDHIPSSGSCELKPWEGKTVQLKISMQTDALLEPQGHGLYIDDIKILGSDYSTYPVVLFHDDGTAESLTYLEYEYVSLAVKYDSFYGKGAKKVVGFEFYMKDEGSREDLNFRIWDDDGIDGFPGTVLYELSLDDTWLPQGWNKILIGSSYQITLDEGYFYCGFEGPSTTHAFGVDESSNGWSVRFVEGDWYDESEGEYMVRVLVEESLGIGDKPDTKLEAIQNISPNPFSENLTIQYSISADVKENVEIRLYDINGRRVQTLVNEAQMPGEYQVEWNSKGFPAGIYFCLFRAGNSIEIVKLVKMN